MEDTQELFTPTLTCCTGQAPERVGLASGGQVLLPLDTRVEVVRALGCGWMSHNSQNNKVGKECLDQRAACCFRITPGFHAEHQNKRKQASSWTWLHRFPSTWEVEAERLWIWRQPRLHSKQELVSKPKTGPGVMVTHFEFQQLKGRGRQISGVHSKFHANQE